MKHRPVGIGVQGLVDAFIKMHLPFDSHEARYRNRHPRVRRAELRYRHRYRHRYRYRCRCSCR